MLLLHEMIDLKKTRKPICKTVEKEKSKKRRGAVVLNLSAWV